MIEIERAIEKKEYIERGALIAFVREVRKKLPKDSKDIFTRDEMLLNFQQYLKLQKAADVAEVVHGEWETDRDTIRCSVCGFGYFPNGYFFKDGQCIGGLIFDRCPNCGAHIDGEKEGV